MYGERSVAFMVLMGILERKRPLKKHRRRWEDNIKMHLRKWDGGHDWLKTGTVGRHL